MRRVFPLLVLAMLGCKNEEEPAIPARPAVRYRWITTQPTRWDLQFKVPDAWKDAHTIISESEIHFNGPEDDGWKPELLFGWVRSRRDVRRWVRNKVESFDNPPTSELVDRAPCVVAGMPGEMCVYNYEVKIKGKMVPMRGIAFWFGGYGYIGYVRGTATARTFLDTYGDVFRDAARFVAYNPP